MSVDAAAADRLPWLPDEPVARPTEQPRRNVLGWGAAAIALVAAGGIWIGTRSVHEPAAIALGPQASTTAPLPPPRAAPAVDVQPASQPEVRPVPMPEVRATPVREVRIAARAAHSRAERRIEKPEAAPEKQTAEVVQVQSPAPVPAVAAAPHASAFLPRPWNPRVFAGAAGRVVQIGAFGSVPQAKRGWWFMARAYPAMTRLPAVVRPTRNSHGLTFYRFQVGTTSQAHSEVLCQRMQKIRLSCAVVGLPWKATVER